MIEYLINQLFERKIFAKSKSINIEINFFLKKLLVPNVFENHLKNLGAMIRLSIDDLDFVSNFDEQIFRLNFSIVQLLKLKFEFSLKLTNSIID